jgi:hypothetical protein
MLEYYDSHLIHSQQIFRALSMIHYKLSQTKKNGWKTIKYSSFSFEAIKTLYFLFIVSSSSFLLRLRGGLHWGRIVDQIQTSPIWTNSKNGLNLPNWAHGLYIRTRSKLPLILYGGLHGTKMGPNLWVGSRYLS